MAACANTATAKYEKDFHALKLGVIVSYSEQQHYIICKVKELSEELGRVPMASDVRARFPNVPLDVLFKTHDALLRAAGVSAETEIKFKPRAPKILVFDIETKPLKVWTWGIWDQSIGLDMIIEDWTVLSWGAKWLHDDEVMYRDVFDQEDYTDDKVILFAIWNLLNECDVVLTQNGTKFDVKKLNSRFEEHGFGAPNPYRHIDALKIKKKKFGLTSNKLEFSTNKFNKKYKKLKHSEFPGMSLWIECLKGNKAAHKSMREYCIHDVLSLEELYLEHLIKWDSTINYGVYTGVSRCCPNCGGTDLSDDEDYTYSKTGAFQNFRCKNCGTVCNSKHNELSDSLKKGLLK